MQVRKDIKIFVGNELSSVKKCPTTVVSNNPCFKWVLPDDIKGKQTRFCLQIKSITPHVLSSGKVDYAFYQSGDIESKHDFFEINFGTTGLFLQSWRGAIAIRLFISTRKKEEVEDIQTPYEYVSDDSYIPGIELSEDKFEILDNSRYFVFDDKSEVIFKPEEIIAKWKNSYDLNNDDICYYAELSKSPLFDKFDNNVIKFDVSDNKKSYNSLSTFIDNNTSYFFRIRSFDGLDYSNWSPVHGFQTSSVDQPIAEITSLENIGNGDIKINFKITETTQNKITLRLLYTGGSVGETKTVPTLLEPIHLFVITEENKGVGSLTWKSLLNEKINADDYLLYLIANNGYYDSEEFIYGPFSINNKDLFYYKTSGGSYFLTFSVKGNIDVVQKGSFVDVKEHISPVVCRNGIIKKYKYLGYNNSNIPFENLTIYGFLRAENPNTFCVITPMSVYRTIYHHGKYMLQDYMIPSRNSEEKSSTTADEDISLKENNGSENSGDKLEKDPYVVAPPYNPILNTDKKGVNKSLVYSTSKKMEDENGNPLPLPNGEWYSSKEEENGITYFFQSWGSELKGNYGFGKFVFEDDNKAPQFTLNPDDIDENGYPKPVSYSEFENIGKDTTVYIKKYRIENGFYGNPKNFIVQKVGNEYKRKYIGVRGEAPKIIYENGIPFWSYNGVLINKYSDEETDELPENFPKDSIYLPQSIWKKKIKYQHIAVPYYVVSTEAIYRPGDHRAGVVGKGEPIIANPSNKKVIKTTGNVKETNPVKCNIAKQERDNLYVGYGKSKSDGIYLSKNNDLYMRVDNKIKTFIYHDDTIQSFLERNYNALIQFNKDTVIIYDNVNFEKLSELMIERKDYNKNVYPYYARIIQNEDKEYNVYYFVLGNPKEFYYGDIVAENSKKIVEINIEEKLYYSLLKETPLLVPKEFDFPVFGSGLKEQRYLTNKRERGKEYEKFDFIDYVCKSYILGGETMYYAGVNGWSENEIVDDYNRAIKFICNIKLDEKLKELKIIYLQYYWDSYNKIHWTGNLGVNTYIRIEYTKLENGKECGWEDLKFQSSIFNEKLRMWLIKPQTYSSLIDNFNYSQFEDGFQYRMRISGVDFSSGTTNVIGPVIATPDFYIDDDSINPFVIEEMEFNPWNKKLKIVFRVDDLQGDLYDITSLMFTTDEKIWEEVNLGDIIGNTQNLSSNTLKNRETNQIITHVIEWSLSGYITSSSNIRIQIYGTLSKYNVEFDYPFFSWICWDNQRTKIAEDEENSILGQWVRYEKSIDKNGKTVWKELETQVRQPGGELEVLLEKINNIRSAYENSDTSKTYDEWLQSTYDGGITLASRLQSLQSDQNLIQKRLYTSKRLRFEGESFTRKELIKQGFYCNGFVNNDYNNSPFEYKVLNLPSSGHSSTIDWGSEKEKITLPNGNFEELTSVIANIESLNEAGFSFVKDENGKEIKELPVGIYIDEKSYPALIGVVKNNSTNYLYINNSNKTTFNDIEGEFLEAEINVKNKLEYSHKESKISVFPKKKTSFSLELEDTYGLGKYELFFNAYTNDNSITNSIHVKIERYRTENEKHCLISSSKFCDLELSKTSSKHTFYYKEENKEVIYKTEFSKLVFDCTGIVFITGIGIRVNEIVKEEESVSDYSLSNIIVKGKIGERKKDNEIGEMMSDDEMSDEEKYTVYYRFQLDFNDDFYSQRFGVPLRDIIFTKKSSLGEIGDNEEEFTRIRGGQVRDGVYLINKDVTNAKDSKVVTSAEEIMKKGESLETEKAVMENGEVSSITFNPNNDKRKYCNLTIQKSDLPGEWNKKQINTSFPDFYDKSGFTSGFFNGSYYWRVAPYNIVECEYEEISHSVIKSINKGKDAVSIEINSVSNEQIEMLKFTGNYWYCKEKLIEQKWEFDWSFEEENKENEKFVKELHRGLVTFPTDAPRTESGTIIIGENSINHIPSSIDRTKPFVIKDNDEFNYYSFYSKTSLLKQNVIIQSTGKKWDKFAELSQLYPKYVLDKYTDYNSMFSPCALFVSLKEKKENESVKRKEVNQKILYVWATAQTKKNELSTVIFKSDVGKVDFSEPVACNGLNGVYHPYVIKEDEKFVLIGCKNHLSKSCLFLYSSKDGINWENENNGEPILIPENNISSPCINKSEGLYKVYLTEWIDGTSQIISYETSNLKSLLNKKIELQNTFVVNVKGKEITYKNPRNACVIDDVYLCNPVKRMYYNVDVSFNEKTETVIKTMFLESGVWIKGTKGFWGDKEFKCSIFGENSIIGLYVDGAVDVDGVRVELDLYDAYKKMQKECILQSDWINEKNYLEYGAEISPPRQFIYNSILKDKKYTGE